MLRFFCTYLMLVLFSAWLSSENKSFTFTQQYTVSDGLSHNGVTAILEDSRSYVWIGTYDGLNRYDGYEFLTFKNTLENDVLFNNRIRALFEDSNRNIWIGTEDGISVYSDQKQKIVNVYSNKQINIDNKGPVILKIIEDKQSNRMLCATEGDGILIFDLEFNYIESIMPGFAPGETYKESIIYDIEWVDSSNYLLATSGGLVHFNLKTHHFNQITKRISRFTGFVKKIKEGQYLTNLDSGVALIHIEGADGKCAYDVKNPMFTDYQFISSSVDIYNDLWLGSVDHGVMKITDFGEYLKGKTTNISWFNLNSADMDVICISSSPKTGTWVGATYNRGVFRFENKRSPFKHYNSQKGGDHVFPSDNIMSLSVLDKDRIYVCTLNKGVSLFNTKTKKCEPFHFNLPPRINRDRIKSIHIDANGEVWLQVGFQGLFVYNTETQQWRKPLSNGKHRFLDFIIRSYCLDDEGNMWLGCRGGVYKIERFESGILKRLENLSDNPFFKGGKIDKVRCVYEDPAHNYIWIGTSEDGLFRIKKKENTSLVDLEIDQYVRDKSNPHSISSNFVTSILRLPNNQLWLSTERGGVCRVNDAEEEPHFLAYAEKNGLSNHVVTSMQHDEDMNLWVSTNIGINKFDLATNKFRSFSKDEGLPFEAFKYGSARMENNELVFFGYDGICYFNPKDISDNLHKPNFEFGDLRLFNKIVLPGDTINKRVIIDRRLDNNGEIVLKNRENVFSIELKSLHFSNSKNHLLRYQLLPVNKDWIEIPSDQRFVNYNELRPGGYVLRAMASNSFDKWSDIKELKITIKPPWWKTIWALLLYVFVLGAIVYVFIIFRMKMLSLQHSLEIDQLEIDKVKEVNAAKLRYFSNISHEIKTPLTLITGPVENLAARFVNHSEISEKLNIIHRQSKKITQLVDQVHDFQKSDANQLKMNYSEFSFSDFINELSFDFKFLAKNSDREFTIEGEEDKIFVSADKDKIEKILNNLLSNAFKYSNSNDSITIKFSSKGKDLLVEVSDTGRGIDSKDLPFIFERFYQSHQKNSPYIGGSGIGLAFSKRLVDMHYGTIHAESEIGVGTTINLRLPIVIKEKNKQQSIKEKEILEAGKISISEIHKEEVGIDIKVEGSFSEARIFLVEDNTDMRLFVAGTLENYFKVKSFANGSECLEAMEQDWPDIIVSDVLMPQMNGFELCRAVKNDIKTSHIPVVLLTACTTIDDQIKGLKEGADAYIKKPFNMQHLVTNVETILKNRKQLRERFQMNFPLTLESEETDGNTDNIFLEKLYEVMSENLDNPDLDVNQLAKKLLLNRTHLYEKVRAITNQTPFEFIKTFRITKAAQLLVQDRVTVNEAVVMTGFKSRTSFTNLFKDKYGVTPGKYADEMKKNLE